MKMASLFVGTIQVGSLKEFEISCARQLLL